MSASAPTPGRARATVLLVAAVCLVAANMRPTITALGPLLDEVQAGTGLATATLGVLAAVPLLTWAAVSPFAHRLSARFGLSRVVLWSLLVLAVGTIVRSLPGPTVGLWLGTAIIGVALAVANVLMPAVVKRDFPHRTPLVMAVYTSLLGGVGAVASGVAVPLSHLELAGGEAGWRVSLAVTGLTLLPVAVVVWILAQRPTGSSLPAPRGGARRGMWRDAVAWQVAAYMGLQSAVFYMTLTWLAAISVSAGRSAVVAGYDVMLFQLCALVGAPLVPLVFRGRLARVVPAVIPAFAVVGVVGLLVSPGAAIPVWAGAIGLTSGASLGMALTLVAVRARDAGSATALSGMAQSVGYLLAAAGPAVFGALHAATRGWSASLVLLLATVLLLAGTGVAVGRDRFVGDR